MEAALRGALAAAIHLQAAQQQDAEEVIAKLQSILHRVQAAQATLPDSLDGSSAGR